MHLEICHDQCSRNFMFGVPDLCDSVLLVPRLISSASHTYFLRFVKFLSWSKQWNNEPKISFH